MIDRPSVPMQTAALCADCAEIFDSRLGAYCPRCASAAWNPVASNRASEEIERLRDQLELAKGVLIQIAWARFTPAFKESLAKRTLKHFSDSAQNEKAAGGASPAAKSQKGPV